MKVVVVVLKWVMGETMKYIFGRLHIVCQSSRIKSFPLNIFVGMMSRCGKSFTFLAHALCGYLYDKLIMKIPNIPNIPESGIFMTTSMYGTSYVTRQKGA